MIVKTPLPTLAATLVVVALGALFAASLAASEPDRPPARAPEVARRALVLQAIYSLRLHPRRGERASRILLTKLESDRRNLVAWLKAERLFGAATPWERRVLETPAGELEPADGARASRQLEPMNILLYSTGALDAMPPYDGSGGAAAASKLPGLLKPTARFVHAARMRPRADIESSQEIAALWHWRAHTKGLVDAKKFPKGKTLRRHAKAIAAEMRLIGMEPKPVENGEQLFVELVRFSAHWAHKEGKIAAPIDDDYPVRGKPYRDLDAARSRRLRAIAEARARTLNWLLGFGVDWDSAPVDI